MAQQHTDDNNVAQGIPISAVYRQLDDHPLAGVEEYDPAAAVARLMTRWIGDDAAMQDSGSPVFPLGDAAASAMFHGRRELVLALASRRFASMIAAFAAIMGIAAAAAAVLLPRLGIPIVAGIGVTAVLLTLAVVLVHRSTMRSMVADHDRLLGLGTAVSGRAGDFTIEPEEPPHREDLAPVAAFGREDRVAEPTGRRRRSYLGVAMVRWVLPAVILLAYVTIHTGGSAGFIVLAAVWGGVLLPVLMVIITALCARTERAERAFTILRMMMNARDRDASRAVSKKRQVQIR
jgi:limonene-1,2-epoxide hydrolase